MVVLSIIRKIAQSLADVLTKKLLEVLGQSPEMLEQFLFKLSVFNGFSLAHSENDSVVVLDNVSEQNEILEAGLVVFEWI